MSRQFGSGTIWGTPVSDAFGNASAIPTPFQLGILQDVSFDASFEEKLLYGKKSFAVDSGRGKGKVGIKAKAANINILPYSAVFFGQLPTTGLIGCYEDAIGQAIPANGTVALVLPQGVTFFANLGVRSDAVGTPFIRVAANPTTGQYTTDGNGNYVFAVADQAKNIYIDYQFFNAAVGQTLAVKNLSMGLSPTFRLDFSMVRNGKVLTFSFPKVMSSKLGMSSKQEDFMIPELDMSAIADDNDNLWTWSSSE